MLVSLTNETLDLSPGFVSFGALESFILALPCVESLSSGNLIFHLMMLLRLRMME